MNKTRIIIIAAIVIALAAFAYVRFSDPRNDAGSPPSGTSPTETDPAMTTESAPQLKEEGITPLPTDAVGVSPPEEKR